MKQIKTSKICLAFQNVIHNTVAISNLDHALQGDIIVLDPKGERGEALFWLLFLSTASQAATCASFDCSIASFPISTDHWWWHLGKDNMRYAAMHELGLDFIAWCSKFCCGLKRGFGKWGMRERGKDLSPIHLSLSPSSSVLGTILKWRPHSKVDEFACLKNCNKHFAKFLGSVRVGTTRKTWSQTLVTSRAH